MKIACVLAVVLLGCGAAADEVDSGEPPVGEVASALSKGQVAAMNAAAQGTGIGYALTNPPDPDLPETLTLQFAPHPQLRRVSRYHLADNSHIAAVIASPDPCSGASCKSPAVRVGHADTAWSPPDPCLPPDPCKTHFDIAGANLRIVGRGGDNTDGAFIASFQVLDANGSVVFDSETYQTPQ